MRAWQRIRGGWLSRSPGARANQQGNMGGIQYTVDYISRILMQEWYSRYLLAQLMDRTSLSGTFGWIIRKPLVFATSGGHRIVRGFLPQKFSTKWSFCLCVRPKRSGKRTRTFSIACDTYCLQSVLGFSAFAWTAVNNLFCNWLVQQRWADLFHVFNRYVL